MTPETAHCDWTGCRRIVLALQYPAADPDPDPMQFAFCAYHWVRYVESHYALPF